MTGFWVSIRINPIYPELAVYAPGGNPITTLKTTKVIKHDDRARTLKFTETETGYIGVGIAKEREWQEKTWGTSCLSRAKSRETAVHVQVGLHVCYITAGAGALSGRRHLLSCEVG